MKQFLLGVLVASMFQAGASLATDDGNYWWQQQEMQRRQQAIEESNHETMRNRERNQFGKQPC